MLNNLYHKITNINLVAGIAAYILVLSLYMVVPESITIVRHAFASLAQLMLLALAIAIVHRAYHS
jgi:hypothetical protein